MVGVLGIDFTIRYFYKVLLEVMPVCRGETVRCFVMDDRGYLIAHPRLVEPAGREPVEQQHITHQVSPAPDNLRHARGLKFQSANQSDHDLAGEIQRGKIPAACRR